MQLLKAGPNVAVIAAIAVMAIGGAAGAQSAGAQGLPDAVTAVDDALALCARCGGTSDRGTASNAPAAPATPAGTTSDVGTTIDVGATTDGGTTTDVPTTPPGTTSDTVVRGENGTQVLTDTQIKVGIRTPATSPSRPDISALVSDTCCDADVSVVAMCPPGDADKTLDQLTPAAAVRAILCLVNQERQKAGLQPLVPSKELTTAAQGHANDAVRIKWWDGPAADAHTNPQTLSTPKTRALGAGYCANGTSGNAAENALTAFGALATPGATVKAWMQSGDHRDHILDPAFREIGVGLVAESATPGVTTHPAGTFVVVFGWCR